MVNLYGVEMEYPKINSLWKREAFGKDLPKGSHGKMVEGDYAQEEFRTIRSWHVTEKVDGTNIRVMASCGAGECSDLRFGGRTKDAQIPCHLLDCLQRVFTKESILNVFPEASSLILFGEGYGPKIQACGGNYRTDTGFILFDVWVGGWWLQRADVMEIAKNLGVSCVPVIGIMEEKEVVDFVKSRPLSRCSDRPQEMEGVVCRSQPLMLTRRGQPVMFKLKCKEF